MHRVPARSAQRGGAKFKAIFWLLVLIAGAYAGWKIIPPYFSNYQLEDRMKTEARFALYNKKTPAELQDLIFKEIQDHDIPANKDDVKVEINSRGVKISVDYTVPIDLQVYKFALHFNPIADSRML